jgi:hypothetical protein
VTVQVPQGNTINGGSANFTTPTANLGGGRTAATVGITAVNVTLGSGTDTVSVSVVSLPKGLTITGTGGDKTINAGGNVGSLTITLSGNGKESSSFTGLNVAGNATITHPGTGDTILTISNGTNAALDWGSLTVSNGSGFDTNAIGDVNFSGSVTIKNGAGGSFTNVSASNDQNLTTIGGNLTISTTSGVSESEFYDYNIHGNVAISTGPGVSGEKNYVGLENIKSFPNSGVPVVSGSVTVVGSSPANGTLDVVAGTDLGDPSGPGTASDLPLTILGNLTITANGPASAASGVGAVFIDLNDLNVPNGTTSITTGPTTTAAVDIQAGTGLLSVYNNVTITLNGAGNVINVQDQAGTVRFTGAVTVTLNTGTNSTIDAGADTNNDTGVANAQLFFYGKITLKAVKAGNKLFGEPNHTINNNIFFVTLPVVSSNFTFA